MNKTFTAVATAALLAASFQLGAQQNTPATPAESRANPSALFTQQERDQFREKMRAAKTPEERAELTKQRRAATEKRAKEKGVTLPRGPEGRPGAGKDGGRPQLFTPEERTQYRDKMRAAKTPEERATLRKQMREVTEQRAKEKGIKLPERRDRNDPPKGAAAPGKS